MNAEADNSGTDVPARAGGGCWMIGEPGARGFF
jgi:hypothetical protein